MRLSTCRIQLFGSRADDRRCDDDDVALYVETKTESDLMAVHVVGFNGRIIIDTSKSDGTPRKPPYVHRLAMACPHDAARQHRDGQR